MRARLPSILALLLVLFLSAIAGAQPPGYNPDLNGDGYFDSQDQAIFDAFWVAHDPRADLDGTATWTANDYQALLNSIARSGLGPPPSGWTWLSPPPTARLVYCSSSTGNDANPGTSPAAPVASVQRGLDLLRDGQPDQLLFLRGDTWNVPGQITLLKSAASTNQYMVIGAYGPGTARPKLVFPGQGFYGGNNHGQRNGLAIVSLELACANATSNVSGITLLSTTGAAWDDVLIEDCFIHNFGTGIVAQTLVDGNVFRNFKLRRSIIADNDYPGEGHAQGLFMGGAQDWLVEGNVFDNNARSKADMFCHNVYIHQLSGPGIFRDNISARACSHGAQCRPGGTVENNLFLQCPIALYQGTSALPNPAAVNYIRNNVALDSRDINSTDRRGFGFVLGGAANTVVEYNVAAHQHSGSAAVTAFDFDGINAATIRGNLVYDWGYNLQPWGTAYQWDGAGGNGAVLFELNQAYQPNKGMCVRHDGRCLDSSFTYRNNRYFSTNLPSESYQQFARCAGTGGPWSWWQSAAGEAGTVFAAVPALDVRIETYNATLSRPATLEDFMGQARLQSKTHWIPAYTTKVINGWVRARGHVGPAAPPPSP